MDQSLNAKKIAVALIIIGTIGLRAAEVQPARTTARKAPSPLRIVVLPFENTSGDAVVDDWPEAWPGLVRTFLREATALDTPTSKRIKPALEGGGWKARNNSAEAAKSIASGLKANVVVWGQVARRTNRCVATLTLQKLGSATRPVQMEIISSNWVALAQSAVVRLAEHLGQELSEKNLLYWRSQLPESDKAVALLGRAIALEIADSPRADQEEVLRKLLIEDQLCSAWELSRAV